MIQARQWTPFGVEIGGTASARLGYAGEWQEASGLVYLRARWYDPAASRFLSRDPWDGMITNPQTLNPYAYAHNQPTRFTDPSGKTPLLAALAGVELGLPLLSGLGAAAAACYLSIVCGVAVITAVVVGAFSLAYLCQQGVLCRETMQPGTDTHINVTDIDCDYFELPDGNNEGPDGLPPRRRGLTFALITTLIAVGTHTFNQMVPQAAPQPAPQSNPNSPVSTPTPQGNGLPVFVPGNDTPETTDHIIRSIASGRPTILTYRGGGNQYNRGWLDAICGAPRPTGMWCDEYPFASTDPGGRGVATAELVPAWEQRIQAKKLKSFYEDYNIKQGDQFIVAPDTNVLVTTYFGPDCK